MAKITLEDLKSYDGKEGRPAYVVVDGRVYDVSKSRMWKNGKHMKSHEAGQDLSVAIRAAPHGRDVFEDFELVGELEEKTEEEKPAGLPEPPPLVEKLLAFHPHPVTVHFPIGLSVTAALLTIVGLASGLRSFETAAFYNLCVATLATPPAVSAGVLSWYYNYAGMWTPVYKYKAIFSGLLFAVEAAALAVYFTTRPLEHPDTAEYWIYSVLVMALAPVVINLGRLGGKITFPS